MTLKILRSWDKKQQQAVAVGILMVFIVVVLSITLLPIWTVNSSYRTTIGQMQDRLQQLRENVESGARLQPRYAQLKRIQMSNKRHLNSDTEAVAAAELQRIIKDIVVENGAQIVSTQILPTSQKQAQQEVFLPVSLKVRLRGTLADVVDTLYDIETGETFLFLDNVIMRDSTGGRSTRAKSNTKLDVNFDLTAYMPITS
jgi:hypothetical protein